jgi:hypothetical protein
VECTRDALGDRIGRALAGHRPGTRFAVIDPFAGSCNTLFWILHHVPNAEGIAFELDPQVYELSKRNVASLDTRIELINGDYQSLLDGRRFPPGCVLIVFVAPPWGTALDEVTGLDLRRTIPPITDIIGRPGHAFADHPILFATQVYEKLNTASLSDLQGVLDWSELRVYELNVEGRNHGILLGSKGWTP